MLCRSHGLFMTQLQVRLDSLRWNVRRNRPANLREGTLSGETTKGKSTVQFTGKLWPEIRRSVATSHKMMMMMMAVLSFLTLQGTQSKMTPYWAVLLLRMHNQRTQTWSGKCDILIDCFTLVWGSVHIDFLGHVALLCVFKSSVTLPFLQTHKANLFLRENIILFQVENLFILAPFSVRSLCTYTKQKS